MNAIACLKVNRFRKAANSTTQTCHSQSPKAAGLLTVHFLQNRFHIDHALIPPFHIPWLGKRVLSDTPLEGFNMTAASGLGSKRTSRWRRGMSAFRSTAVIDQMLLTDLDL